MKLRFGQLKIIPAKASHIKYLAANMRREDMAELAAAGPDGPRAALEKSFAVSARCFTAFFGGLPLCMFGVAPQGLLSGRAVLWLLGTERIKKCPGDFCKATLYFIREFSKEYTLLFNLVDARYTSAIRWLEFAGARFAQEKSYGPQARPFKYFEIKRS